MSPPPRSTRARLAVLGILAGALLGCPSEPSQPIVASVTVGVGQRTLTVGQTTQATATLRTATDQPVTGRTVTWSSEPSGIATVSAAGIVTAQAAGPATITALVEPEGLSGSIELEVFGSDPNLTLDNLHLTQAVQRFEGAIPLVVGGNPVLVNLFGTLDRPFPAGSPAPRVRIELLVGAAPLLTDERTMNGVASPSLNPGSPLHRVVLPASVVEPGLRVRATINPGGLLAEASLSDNTWPRSGDPLAVPVQEVPPLPLRFVPVLLTAGGTTGNVSAENLPEYLTATRQMHPVGAVESDIGPVFSSDVAFGNGDEAAWLALLQQVDLLRVMEGSSSYYLGAVRPPPGVTFVQFGGYGYIPLNPQSTGPNTRTAVLVGVGWFNRARQTTELVAHELAHTMGRRHAPCGGAAFPDPGFPYPNGRTGGYGHDLYSWSLTPAGLPAEFGPDTGDVMSYCVPVWISDYTYQGLLAARGGTVHPQSSLLTSQSSSCPCLIVWGSVTGDSIRLEPSFVAPPPARPAAAPAGSYALEGLSEAGDRIFRVRFEPHEVDHAAGVRHFTLAIPLAMIERNSLARIAVRGEGRFAERPATAGIPVLAVPGAVRFSGAGSGFVTVRWNPAEFPLLVVRNSQSGRILGVGTSGTIQVRSPGAGLEVILSDGVGSAVVRER